MIKSVDYYQQRGVWQSWDLRDVNAPVFCVCVYGFRVRMRIIHVLFSLPSPPWTAAARLFLTAYELAALSEPSQAFH